MSDYILMSKLAYCSHNLNAQDSEGNTIVHLIYQNFNDGRCGDFYVLEKMLNLG
jgi:hypothetical protein